jgi:hypothetical protein
VPVPSAARSSTSVPSTALRVLTRVSTRVHRVVAGALALSDSVGALLTLVRTVEGGVQVGAIHSGVLRLLCSQPNSTASRRSGTSWLSLKGRSGRRSRRRLIFAELHVVILRGLTTLLTNGSSQLLLVLRETTPRAEESGNSISVTTCSRMLRKRLLSGARVHARVIRDTSHRITALSRRRESAQSRRRRRVVGVLLLRGHVLGVAVHVLAEGTRLRVEVLHRGQRIWSVLSMRHAHLVHELVVVRVEGLLHRVLTHALVLLLGSLHRSRARSSMATSLITGRTTVTSAWLLNLTRTRGRRGNLTGRFNRSTQTTCCTLLRGTSFLLSMSLLLSLHVARVAVETESGGLRPIGVVVVVLILRRGNANTEMRRLLLLRLHVLSVVLGLVLRELRLSLSGRLLRGRLHVRVGVERLALRLLGNSISLVVLSQLRVDLLGHALRAQRRLRACLLGRDLRLAGKARCLPRGRN